MNRFLDMAFEIEWVRSILQSFKPFIPPFAGSEYEIASDLRAFFLPFSFPHIFMGLGGGLEYAKRRSTELTAQRLCKGYEQLVPLHEPWQTLSENTRNKFSAWSRSCTANNVKTATASSWYENLASCRCQSTLNLTFSPRWTKRQVVMFSIAPLTSRPGEFPRLIPADLAR